MNDPRSAPAPAGEGRGEGKRLWRVLAGTLGTLLVVAALLITALRIAIAYLPDHADRLRSWVERETRMRIEYQRLDAQLRWYGPELVLTGARVLDEPGSQTLFTAREGRIGVTVTFLAILELIKETLIDVVQTEPFGPIHIRAAQTGPGPNEVSEDRVQNSGTDDQYNG